jgi:hypothetical protein
MFVGCRNDVTQTMITRRETAELIVKWRLKPRTYFTWSNSILQNPRSLFAGVSGESSIKILMCEFHSLSKDVAISLQCQQLRS